MLVNAIDDADTRVEEQLLTSRRLARETTPDGKPRAMLALAMMHLAARGVPRGRVLRRADRHRCATTRPRGSRMPLRAARRAAARRATPRAGAPHGRVSHGRRSSGSSSSTHGPLESPMAEDLTHLVRSEIADSLGDKAKARSELEAVTVDETTPAPIVDAYYQYADALYRQLDDREALVTLCRQPLRERRAPIPTSSLHYARAAVRAMVRGLPYADADARLARERAGATDAKRSSPSRSISARAVLAIRDAHAPQAVGDALLALYAAQTRPGRRRALIVDAVQRADEVDADDVLDALVQRDIHDVKRGTHERGETEDVYERLILARAYERAGGEAITRSARARLRRGRRADGVARGRRRRDRHAPEEGREPARDRGPATQKRGTLPRDDALREGVSDRAAAPEARRRRAREGGGARAGGARRLVVGAQRGAHRAGALRRAPPRGVPADRRPRARPSRRTPTTSSRSSSWATTRAFAR